MKYALISPNENPISHISGWTTDTPSQPIWSAYPNSCRVAEVADTEFPIANPLFWVECNDNVEQDKYYYDLSSNVIYPVVNEPGPTV